MTTIEQIQENALYKQVLKDSIGGLMYDVGKRNSYEVPAVQDLLAQWDSLDPSEQSSAGGIMRGAMDFLKGE